LRTHFSALILESCALQLTNTSVGHFPRLLFFILPIRIGNWIVYRRDEKKYHTIDEKNAGTVRAMNSRDLLLGRTLIVSAIKPR
jgi:hypothetical protein